MQSSYLIKDLTIIPNVKGDIYKALSCDDLTFNGIEEAYFTCIKYKETKGWKKHLKMQLNLIVVSGVVEFHIKDDSKELVKNIEMSANKLARLTIFPGVWVSFTGSSNEKNMILNLANLKHDPLEVSNKPLDFFE